MNLLAADSHSLGDFDAEEGEAGVEDIGGGGSESNFVRRRRVVLIDYFFLSVKAVKDRGKLNQKSNDIMRSILSPRSFHYFRESVQIFFQFCYFKILRSSTRGGSALGRFFQHTIGPNTSILEVRPRIAVKRNRFIKIKNNIPPYGLP